MFRRRITCSCMAASNTACRPLPSALARYMATSASRMTSSGWESAVASAIPMEAPTNSSRPSSSNGAVRLCWTRSAIIVASCGSHTSSSSSVNSSPPRRATVSVGPRAGCGVVRPQGGLQPLGDGLQQLVAGLVAERVVDHLEAVEVEEQHGRARLRVVAAGAPDRLVEAVEEQHAVGEAGERVVERVVLQAALGLAAVRDVGERADDARGPAVLVAHRDGAGEHPAVAAVAVLDPMLELEVLAGGLGEVGVERLRERGPLVGVHAPEPLAPLLAERVLAVAEHGLP